MLKFSEANAKTKSLYDVPELRPYLDGRKVYSLDMLSGWSCPGAKDCLAKVINDMGKRKLVDGPETKFRCFSASQEVVYTNTYKLRRHNFDLVKSMRGVNQIRSRMMLDIPKDCGVLRYHVAGDFFKLPYLQAAVQVAELRPDILFYGYTKSLNFLQSVDCLQPEIGLIRENFLLTGSRGGRYDSLLEVVGLREARVVFSEDEAASLDLEIDHDDSHAATVGGSFALLLHGVQPKGSEAAAALRELKGKGSYNRKVKV